MLSAMSIEQLSTYTNTSFWIALLLYAGMIALLYHSSPLTKRRSLWMGLLFIATASLATAAYYIVFSGTTAANIAHEQAAAALLLGSRAQTYLVVIGIVGGGIGGNLVASALTQ